MFSVFTGFMCIFDWLLFIYLKMVSISKSVSYISDNEIDRCPGQPGLVGNLVFQQISWAEKIMNLQSWL